MIIKRKLLLFGILICILVGIKLIRLLPVPGISVLWNFHIYFYLILSVLVFLSINKFLRNTLDKLILILLISISFLVIFRHIDDMVINIVKYIIPILAYYLFRNISITYNDLYKLFYIISGFLIALFFIDFFSNNILNLHIFDYSKFQEISLQNNRIVGSMQDMKVHPILGDKLLRVGGITFTPQSSAVLYASFSIFHLYIYNKTKSIKQLCVFLLYLIILILYNSGTSLVVLVLLFIIIKQSFVLNILLVILSIPILFLLIIVMYGSIDIATATFELVFNGIYDVYLVHIFNMNEFFFTSLLLGTGFVDSQNPIILKFEIDYIDLIFQLGLINMTILIFLIVYSRKYFFNLLKNGIDIMPFYYLMLGIIIGSMHYQSMFKYPNSMFLFGIIGIVSRFYINEKRVNIENK